MMLSDRGQRIVDERDIAAYMSAGTTVRWRVMQIPEVRYHVYLPGRLVLTWLFLERNIPRIPPAHPDEV